MAVHESRKRIEQFQGQGLASSIASLDKMMADYRGVGAVLKGYMQMPTLTDSDSSQFMAKAKELQAVIKGINISVRSMYYAADTNSIKDLEGLLLDYARTAYGEEHEVIIGAMEMAFGTVNGMPKA